MNQLKTSFFKNREILSKDSIELGATPWILLSSNLLESFWRGNHVYGLKSHQRWANGHKSFDELIKRCWITLTSRLWVITQPSIIAFSTLHENIKRINSLYLLRDTKTTINRAFLFSCHLLQNFKCLFSLKQGIWNRNLASSAWEFLDNIQIAFFSLKSN